MSHLVRVGLILAVLTLVARSGAAATPVPIVVAGSFAPGPRSSARPARGPVMPRTRASGRLDAAAATANSTHVVYFVPRDRPDEGLDTSGTIGRSVASMVAWFRVQMGKAPRIERSGTDYNVTYVSGAKDAAGYTKLTDITDELSAKGFTGDGIRYLIYAAVDEGSVCGEGEYPTVPGTTGHYAAVYLDSSAGCGARDFGNASAGGSGKTETIAAHEWLHNEGVEPLLAPHHCASSPYHVCTGPLWLADGVDPEEPDVVFPVITARLSAKVLDRDRDDYLDHPWPHLANLRDSAWLE